MIKRWPYHVMATRRHQAKPRTKRLNDKLSAGHLADLWVTSVLVDGADQALLAGEVALAVECLALAHRALPEGRSRIAVCAKLARAEWQINPSAARRHFTPL